ncbi:hypothetical protein Pcinc_021010 [Petrolisthes cinctipes]|uniref:HMG box domain-containing protein n=1 Tax=Petrolisthes cinctipes TaxID=88211 RepID=A0AAE1FHY6_PETCI|nr:hypothetical protein Pcinc_021010 [Petrolisthes cinctipes]
MAQSLYFSEKQGKKNIVLKDGQLVRRKKAQRKDKGKSRFTAYMLWAREVRPGIIQANPNMDFSAVNKRLGELWALVSNTQKYNWKRRAKRLAAKGNQKGSIITTGKGAKNAGARSNIINKGGGRGGGGGGGGGATGGSAGGAGSTASAASGNRRDAQHSSSLPTHTTQHKHRDSTPKEAASGARGRKSSCRKPKPSPTTTTTSDSRPLTSNSGPSAPPTDSRALSTRVNPPPSYHPDNPPSQQNIKRVARSANELKQTTTTENQRKDAGGIDDTGEGCSYYGSVLRRKMMMNLPKKLVSSNIVKDSQAAIEGTDDVKQTGAKDSPPNNNNNKRKIEILNEDSLSSESEISTGNETQGRWKRCKFVADKNLNRPKKLITRLDILREILDELKWKPNRLTKIGLAWALLTYVDGKWMKHAADRHYVCVSRLERCVQYFYNRLDGYETKESLTDIIKASTSDHVYEWLLRMRWLGRPPVMSDAYHVMHYVGVDADNIVHDGIKTFIREYGAWHGMLGDWLNFAQYHEWIKILSTKIGLTMFRKKYAHRIIATAEVVVGNGPVNVEEVVVMRGHINAYSLVKHSVDTWRVILALSGDGHFFPPLFIQKGYNTPSRDLPPHLLLAATSDGHPDPLVFLSWLRMLDRSLVKVKRPVVVLLQGHPTMASPAAISLAIERGLILHSHHPTPLNPVDPFLHLLAPLIYHYKLAAAADPASPNPVHLLTAWNALSNIPNLAKEVFMRAGLIPFAPTIIKYSMNVPFLYPILTGSVPVLTFKSGTFDSGPTYLTLHNLKCMSQKSSPQLLLTNLDSDKYFESKSPTTHDEEEEIVVNPLNINEDYVPDINTQDDSTMFKHQYHSLCKLNKDDEKFCENENVSDEPENLSVMWIKTEEESCGEGQGEEEGCGEGQWEEEGCGEGQWEEEGCEEGQGEEESCGEGQEEEEWDGPNIINVQTILQESTPTHTHQHDSTPTHTHQHDSTPTHTHQHDSTTTHTHQHDSTPTHTHQHDSTPTHTHQHDSTPTHTHQHDSTPTHTHQHDSTPTHTHQHDSTPTHTHQHDSTTTYTHQHASTPTHLPNQKENDVEFKASSEGPKESTSINKNKQQESKCAVVKPKHSSTSVQQESGSTNVVSNKSSTSTSVQQESRSTNVESNKSSTSTYTSTVFQSNASTSTVLNSKKLSTVTYQEKLISSHQDQSEMTGSDPNPSLVPTIVLTTNVQEENNASKASSGVCGNSSPSVDSDETLRIELPYLNFEGFDSDLEVRANWKSRADSSKHKTDLCKSREMQTSLESNTDSSKHKSDPPQNLKVPVLRASRWTRPRNSYTWSSELPTSTSRSAQQQQVSGWSAQSQSAQQQQVSGRSQSAQ